MDQLTKSKNSVLSTESQVYIEAKVLNYDGLQIITKEYYSLHSPVTVLLRSLSIYLYSLSIDIFLSQTFNFVPIHQAIFNIVYNDEIIGFTAVFNFIVFPLKYFRRRR